MGYISSTEVPQLPENPISEETEETLHPAIIAAIVLAVWYILLMLQMQCLKDHQNTPEGDPDYYVTNGCIILLALLNGLWIIFFIWYGSQKIIELVDYCYKTENLCKKSSCKSTCFCNDKVEVVVVPSEVN